RKGNGNYHTKKILLSSTMSAMLIFNFLAFSLIMYFSAAFKSKQEWYIKVAKSERSGNITKYITNSGNTVLECATFCLKNEEICSSFNLRKVEGSDVIECKLNGANSGPLVA
ncbi:unnamed protein product, partial [Owenia fusiformis]